MKTCSIMLKAAACAVLLSTQANLVLAQPQTTQTGPMLTPWAADARAGRGWQEYPRPQLVRERWQNLNGPWDYAITPTTASSPANYEGKILVPYPLESTLSGVARGLKPDERLWYRRDFSIPAGWKDQRVLLHFGAVDWESRVYVNGALVGTHRGGFDPFSFDITPYLKTGAQELVVAVTDPTSEDDQPRGKQRLEQSGIWYTPASGIWQTVWLEPVPAQMSIASVKCTPDLDASQLNVIVHGSTIATGDTHYAVRTRVLNDGKVVAENISRLRRHAAIAIPGAIAWTPDNPHLYDLKVELFSIKDPVPPRAKGQPALGLFGKNEAAHYAKLPADAVLVDTVASYAGMRKISLGDGPHGPVLMLNNKPLFQYGPLDQGYWPDGLLTPPTEAAMRYDLDFLKKAGFNMLRKHIKVEPALYYAHCDRIGLLVWQDMPSGFRESAKPKPTADRNRVYDRDEADVPMPSATAAQFETELRAMIDALYPHPSIVIWVPFNEGWGQFDTARISAWVKAYDPSRLTNAVSGWSDRDCGDLYDLHNYREKMDLPNRKDNRRAYVLGEFGGLGLPLEGHLWWTNKRNWGYQTYKTAGELKREYILRLEQVRDFAKERGLSAAVYTQTTDVEGEVNGLLTYDRKVEKLTAAELLEIHKSMKLY